MRLTTSGLAKLLAGNPHISCREHRQGPTRESRSRKPSLAAGEGAGMLEPQQRFLRACQQAFPGRLCVAEYPAGVPGRKFRLDIAFPDDLVAVEVDGWAFHGKHLAAHGRDRERQNLLVIAGWKVIRFSAGQIFRTEAACLEQVAGILGVAAGRDSRPVSAPRNRPGAATGRVRRP